MQAELLGVKHEAIVLFLPNSHPYFNPIEQVWRALKQRYRLEPHKTISALETTIIDGLTGKLQKEGIMTTEQLQRQALRTELIRRNLFEHKGVAKTENQVQKKGFVPSKTPDYSHLDHLRNITTPEGLQSHELYAHYLNQSRRKMFTMGEVTQN
jgi:hypothetical protein